MKAVILAAGMGTRLGSLIPKPLTSIVNEKTIVDFILEKLEPHLSVHDVMMIVGYKKEILMEKFPNLMFIYNEAYTKTNTAKSLLRAVEKIDDDVLWFNGDVFFDSEVIQLLLDTKGSSSLVDTKKCGDEEVKYSVNDSGFVHEISKQVGSDAKGESLGINIIRRADLPAFRAELVAVADDDYFEKALENLTLNNTLQLTPVDVGDHFCQEIDFPEDLDTVLAYVNK